MNTGRSMRRLAASLAAIACAASCGNAVAASPVRAEANADAAGVQSLEFEMKGGASLISLQLRELELVIRGEDRADFGLSLEDGRSGVFVERPPLMSFEREGAALRACVDFGSFQLFRSEAGSLKLLLLVPKGYRGSLSLAFAEGVVELRDLTLAGLTASMTLGRMRATRVSASTASFATRGASAEFDDCHIGSASANTGMGSVKGLGLSGTWKVTTDAGAIDLSFVPGFGAVEAKTTMGGINLVLPPGSAFSFEGKKRLGSVKADFPLARMTCSEVSGVWNVYTGEVGEGGPRVCAKTDAGPVAILRAAR